MTARERLGGIRSWNEVTLLFTMSVKICDNSLQVFRSSFKYDTNVVDYKSLFTKLDDRKVKLDWQKARRVRVNLEYYGYENGALWNLVFLHILNSTENFANRHVRPQHIDVINDTVKLNHVNLEYCEKAIQ